MAFAASVVAPPVGIHKFFSTVENKMSEGAAKIPGATKTIAKQPLQRRPHVAGSAAAPLLAEATSAQSSEDTAKNKGNMAEKMRHAIGGAAKSVVNQMVHNGPQQHGGAGSSSSSLTEEGVDPVPLAIPRRECAEGKRDSVPICGGIQTPQTHKCWPAGGTPNEKRNEDFQLDPKGKWTFQKGRPKSGANSGPPWQSAPKWVCRNDEKRTSHNGGVSGPSGPRGPRGRNADYDAIRLAECMAKVRARAAAGDIDAAADELLVAVGVKELPPRPTGASAMGNPIAEVYALLDSASGCENTTPLHPSPPPPVAFTDIERNQPPSSFTKNPNAAAITINNPCDGREVGTAPLNSGPKRKTSMLNDAEVSDYVDKLRTCPAPLSTGNPEGPFMLAAGRRRSSSSLAGGVWAKPGDGIDSQHALCSVLPCRLATAAVGAECRFSISEDMLVPLFELGKRDEAEGRPGNRPIRSGVAGPWHEAYEDCLDEAQVIMAIVRALLRHYRALGQFPR